MTKFLKAFLKKYHKRKVTRQTPNADHPYLYDHYIVARKKSSTQLMSHFKRSAIIKKKKEEFLIDTTTRGFRGRKIKAQYA